MKTFGIIMIVVCLFMAFVNFINKEAYAIAYFMGLAILFLQVYTILENRERDERDSIHKTRR